MKKKNTDGLQQELMDSPDLSQFLSQNQEQFENKSVAELLNRLFEKKHISKAALAKQAGMSEIYPVSYTHLDVYKRQLSDCNKPIF